MGGGPGEFLLNFPLGCGPGPDPPQLPPWVLALTRSPSTSPLGVGLDQIPLNFPLGCRPGPDPLNFPFGCGPGPDPPQLPPLLWTWRPPGTRHPPLGPGSLPPHYQAPPGTRHPPDQAPSPSPVDRILDTRF